jgi:hypothetical protein
MRAARFANIAFSGPGRELRGLQVDIIVRGLLSQKDKRSVHLQEDEFMKFIHFQRVFALAETASHTFARAGLTQLHCLGQDGVVRVLVVCVEAYSFLVK